MLPCTPASPVAQISSKRCDQRLQPPAAAAIPNAAPRPVDVEAMQVMATIDNDERVHRAACLRAGSPDDDGLAEQPLQRGEPRASAFDVARVVDDDLEPRMSRPAQERGEPIDALRAVPAHLREIDVEHADRALREADQFVDGRDLGGERVERLPAGSHRRTGRQLLLELR